jgi:hypothetical protein
LFIAEVCKKSMRSEIRKMESREGIIGFSEAYILGTQ